MKDKSKFLECLKTTPIIQTACQKTGISRATYYRWRKEDFKFKRRSDIALKNGINFINDLAESQLISSIKDKNMTAIIFWLKNHNPNYSDRRLLLTLENQKQLMEYIYSGNREESSKMVLDNTIQGKGPSLTIASLLSVINKNIQLSKNGKNSPTIELLTKIFDSLSKEEDEKENIK